MTTYKIIDTDTHFVEPADLWTERLPKSWGDRVMHVKWSDELKAEAWYVGDEQVAKAWAGAIFGWDTQTEAYPWAPPSLADVHPSTYNLADRLAAMDECGIWAQALYPNVAGLRFDRFLSLEGMSGEVGLAHVRAYNDYQLEWAGNAIDRFIPLAIIPFWNVDEAVKEIERTADTHRGVITTGAPQVHGQPYLGDHHWDKMWAACQAAGKSVSFHVANGDVSAHYTSERALVDGGRTCYTRAATGSFLDNAQQVNDLLLCGVLARFPDLKFVSVESGIGWIPFVLASSDYHFKRAQMWRDRPEFGDYLPSDLFHRQVFVNYWFEHIDQAHVDAIGEDNILFETDFPHPTCIYRDEIETAVHSGGLEKLDQRVQEKILWRNAAKLFGISLPAHT